MPMNCEIFESCCVTVVFVDRVHLRVSQKTAWKMCGVPEIAGRIVDVLIADKSLQARYRDKIDNMEECSRTSTWFPRRR